MIPLHVRVILYGFDAKVPRGGFPTLGYSKVINSLDRIQNETTIFPETAYRDIVHYFYWSQKTRWAFKKLLLKWFSHKYKDSYGNDEDLFGNSFDDYSTSEILSLWDWRSMRYYRFTREELIEMFTSKLNNNIHPRNPYNNLSFTTQQITRIREFICEDLDIQVPLPVKSYLRFPENMYFNTQVHMNVQGFQTIKEVYQRRVNTPSQQILLREILYENTVVRTHKEELLNEIENTMFPILIHERSLITCFMPRTKVERNIYDMYVRKGLNNTIKYIRKWRYTNRKRLRVKNKAGSDAFVHISSNSLANT